MRFEQGQHRVFMAFYVFDALPFRPPILIAHHDGFFSVLCSLCFDVEFFLVRRRIITESRVAAWRDQAEVTARLRLTIAS